ncbi:MAG: ATP-dependent metallopeptidase FtsH/Yme1/Tma family protein, partial [Clostridia bacterium]|nr:ATP-dependent metallopeptidase FtsH/Yme1/Tma family protein [Clostridia bacterium]
MKKNLGRTIIIWMIVLAIIIAVSTFLFRYSSAETVIYSQVLKDFRSGKVESFQVNRNNVIKYSIGSKIYEHELRDINIFYNDLGSLISEQLEKGTLKEFTYDSIAVSWWVSLIPYAIVIVVFVVIWWLFMSRS